jgi:hypothetical protein
VACMHQAIAMRLNSAWKSGCFRVVLEWMDGWRNGYRDGA